MTEVSLPYELDFAALYQRDGLIRLDREFVSDLAAAEMALHNRLLTARADPAALDKKAESDLIVDLAPHLEDFLGHLFGIAAEVRELQGRHEALAPLYSVKRLFVQRRATREIKEDAAVTLDGAALRRALAPLIGAPADIADTRAGVLGWERRYAEAVSGWLADEAANAAPLRVAIE